MKVGAENKKQLYSLIGLGVVALILLLRVFFSSSTPTGTAAASAGVAVPAQPEAANNIAGQRGRGKAALLPLDPTLRTDLLKNSEGAEYKGSGRNIFQTQAAPPPPIPQPKHPVVTPPIVANVPPPPPPIPLKFYGFANKPGQPKSIFLANGEDIFIGREGEIVNRRYKIVRIMPTQVEIEDVLNNIRQTIPLTQG